MIINLHVVEHRIPSACSTCQECLKIVAGMRSGHRPSIGSSHGVRLCLPHSEYGVFYNSAYSERCYSLSSVELASKETNGNLIIVLDVDLGAFSPCSSLEMQDLGGPKQGYCSLYPVNGHTIPRIT